MLRIKTKEGIFPIENRQNFNIVYDYEGEQTLSFDIACNDSYYPYLKEKTKLIYGDNRYYITKINKRKTISTIEAALDVNEWKRTIHFTFEADDAMFSDIALRILPDGWQFKDMGAAKGRGSLSLQGATNYEVLMECKKIFHIVFAFSIEKQQIRVIDPTLIQQRGLYLSEELNLDSVDYKGEYVSQVNRLYAYGKKHEEKHEDGSTTTSYVSFASINQGNDYVDCMDYIDDEVICAYWQDDSFTEPEALLSAAVDKVKALAFPTQSWGCNIYDLSRTNELYQCLDFKLYDKPVLLIDNMAIVHQIVEYTEYPDQQHLNKVILSTAFKKIEGSITSIQTNMDHMDERLTGSQTTINELRRDVKSNTLYIEDTYRKGDVDEKMTSMLQQTEQGLHIAINQVDEKVLNIEKTKRYSISIHSSRGTSFKNGDVDTQLNVSIYSWDDDITSMIADAAVSWKRYSNDVQGDSDWQKHGKSITITNKDFLDAALFECTWNDITKNISLVNVIDGEAGVPGINGETTYFHVKYASVINPDDQQLSEIPDKFIGTYVDNIQTDSSYAGAYTWAQFQGDAGIAGINGSDGKTTYLHIRYSDDGGKTFTEQHGKTPGEYIGQYTDFDEADSDTTESYTWAKVKADNEIIASLTPIDKTDCLWLDTSIDPNQLKRWNGAEWYTINDYHDDLVSEITSISDIFNSSMEATATDIIMQVSGTYITETKSSESIDKKLTEFKQNDHIFSFDFDVMKQTIEKIDDEVVTNKEEIKKYIRFDDGTIELGESISDFKLKITNQMITFISNGTEVAYITNSKLYIKDANVNNSMKIGNFAFTPRANGNMSIKFIGGV